MKRLILTLAFFMQGGGQPRNIPIPTPTFSVGYGSSFSQNLGVSPTYYQEYQPGYTVDGIYTLTLTAAQNEDPHYPGYAKFEIDFGTQELCESTNWGIGPSSILTFTCQSPGYLIVDQSLNCDQNPCTVGPAGSAQGNSNLVLTVTVNGWIVNFKNAALTFTPVN